MLDFLNKYIGTDWATYLGAGLAIVSIIWGGGKLIKKKTIHQSARASGSTVIQIGGNIVKDNDNEPKS